MSRRTRRARRQLRRGDARREPLLLVADDRPDLIEWIELLGRVGYRYRSELAPSRRRPARCCSPLRSCTTTTSALVGAAGRRHRWRPGCAGRGSRRCCARSSAATPSPSSVAGGGWLTAATPSGRTRHRCRCSC